MELPLLVAVLTNCQVTALFTDNFNMILIFFSHHLSYPFFWWLQHHVDDSAHTLDFYVFEFLTNNDYSLNINSDIQAYGGTPQIFILIAVPDSLLQVIHHKLSIPCISSSSSLVSPASANI